MDKKADSGHIILHLLRSLKVKEKTLRECEFLL